MPQLHINIDHIATIRQARKTIEPSLLDLVKILEYTKASGLTMHLREDRRHVNDDDVREIDNYLQATGSSLGLTFEMAATEEIRDICLQTKARLATLVPERRSELTTEGGLDLISQASYLKEFIKIIQANGTKVSFFVDPDLQQIETAKAIGADFIELHTGTYANLFLKYHADKIQAGLLVSNSFLPNIELVQPVRLEYERLCKAADFANELGLNCNLGHGLTIYNLSPLLQINNIKELHIGHSIVANAVYHGFKTVVDDFCYLISKTS
jgi:pyridoxine 5-phosphate synthase